MQRSVGTMISLPLVATALLPARTGIRRGSDQTWLYQPAGGAVPRRGGASLQYFAYLFRRMYSEGSTPGVDSFP